ncbi:DNA-binding transcriptional regulator, MarR family [Salibacterium halotolerans]|uniref:DNA-binding transcriptional regulator, MarR family n=2 Tax=Salibacterium halotolerans TaxID=1884432 RepID=A0A1I5XTX7_9BACI|nr:DNA-binding transcriptional regulator, MarR family [Salibacterium halotolerans]
MNKEEKQGIARNLLTLFPMMNKKLFPPSRSRQDNDLSITLFFILKTLEDFGDLTSTEVAKKLSIQKSNLTPLVQKLEDSRFVIRYSSAQDRRVKYMSLTEEGFRYLERSSFHLEEEVQKKLGDLQDEDLKKLDDSVLQLQTILAKLEQKR